MQRSKQRFWAHQQLKFLKKNYLAIFLVLLIIFSAFFRFYRLGTIPDGFFMDEAALAYNGWSLMQTGRDEWGELLPLTLRSFDDYKPAIYAYLTIPFILIFDLGHFAARAPAALFGTLLPLAVFGLLHLRKQTKLGLISGLVIASSPWSLEVSRTAIESGVAVALFALSLFCLQLKSKRFLLSGIFLGSLTLLTYHSARIVVPPLILLIGWLGLVTPAFRKAVIVWGAAMMVIGVTLSVSASSSRFTQISIFNSQELLLLREEAIREYGSFGQTPLFLVRLINNKPMSLFHGFVGNYLMNTSPNFLFISGAQPLRASIPQTGQLLIIFAPFLLIGLIGAGRKISSLSKLMYVWLLLAPIPAALTYAEIPHVYRNYFMIVPLSYFIAHGLLISYSLLESKLKKDWQIWSIVGVSLIIFCLFFLRAWLQYSVIQQIHQPWYRQSGYQELMADLRDFQRAGFSEFVITQRLMEPYIFYLFYNQIPPRDFQTMAQRRLSHSEVEAGIESWRLQQMVFHEARCPYSHPDFWDQKLSKTLFVVAFDCELPLGFKRHKSIEFADGNPMFHLDSLDR